MVLTFSTLGLSIFEHFGDRLHNSDKPTGVSRDQIPQGNEDLYILKSQVVPPVCPKCPEPTVVQNSKKCQPCPPCGRCPEPAFECKKVPNYNVAPVSNQLPRPMLNSFADFN
tara:strand:+ start:408 stop:743 length:336 start_codon:yes stop_codon:yes gene_type:complete